MADVMENIGDGMAATSKSAVGPIWLGCQVEKKQPKKLVQPCHFHCFL